MHPAFFEKTQKYVEGTLRNNTTGGCGDRRAPDVKNNEKRSGNRRNCAESRFSE